MPLAPGTPELADLDLLLSVERLGSLGRAAREHGISQPSASARIKLLERRLGMELLDRSPSGSRLTAAGAAVAEWARDVVAPAADLMANVAALRDRASGLLRVAASMTIAEYLMPRWLVALRRERPELTVALRAENSHDVVELLEAGEADLGFIEDPAPHDGLTELVVADDELAVVTAPGHPWSDGRGPLTPGELAAGRLVLRERGSGTRETLHRVLGELREGPHLELSSTTAIKEAVVAGAGAAVLSALAVEHELRTGQLVRVPVAGIELTRRLRAVWPRRSAPAPHAEALLRIAVQAGRASAR
ncbi:LysR family transcriptional regulator [Actinomadura madurae]|uniref:LysR family transcriptional regulator n=1 Tax=Actinomadura madurae TaxID=1993 RepID=UPI00202685C0|nr:LysR family transcriptional regulator [Actinomadura madurae]MCP9951342.1 LysR family transcriptional regulator [Actinomadura madurae]MCP9968114.1 LysR family transcriptional regulator [Actinomadura madurae]MCP9980574.1 LysR family transcriptional regulator [Actinomadura madurae]MCQ0007910.1 LysR family transcriptional regulator [Actinomadura madurae]MCQ0016774.1 LysR family transcriptional regulator [Actinomadura madurae]